MPYIFTLLALITAGIIGGISGFFTVILLGILEISLSFDNAVINASVLKTMSKKWQQRFLTWGILIAVFGMRLVFPIIIVAIASNKSMLNVLNISIYSPEIYHQLLTDCNKVISSFGAAFLLMVFLSFLFKSDKEVFWFKFEKYTSGKSLLWGIFFFLPLLYLNVSWLAVIIGVATYLVIKNISSKFQTNQISLAGFSSFVYLEILDASFSLDGVVGAFAISKNIFLIMLGLGIGSVFIRSLTIKLAQNKTLEQFKYLEHGAHYGICSLSVIMFLSNNWHISEIVTGLTGVFFIILSIWYSKCRP